MPSICINHICACGETFHSVYGIATLPTSNILVAHNAAKNLDEPGRYYAEGIKVDGEAAGIRRVYKSGRRGLQDENRVNKGQRDGIHSRVDCEALKRSRAARSDHGNSNIADVEFMLFQVRRTSQDA